MVYRFADAEMDPSQGCVRRQDHEHYPRPKVLQVLHYLLEHRERLVTKDELIEHVWKDTAVTDDVVFHCVADIRTLLGDDPRNPRFVRTFPGAGYRFVAPVEEVRLANGGEANSSRPAQRLPRWAVWTAGVLLAALPIAWIGLRRGPPEPPREEVAWWRFDEGAGTQVKDSSGHGNDGVLVDGPVWTEGQLGKALRFDGVRSHVAGINDGRSFPRGSAPRTVSAWIRTVSTAGDHTGILHYGAHSSPYLRSFLLCLRDNGKAAVGYQTEWVEGTSRLDDGAWHFVAGMYEGPGTNLARVFVDGVEESAGKLRSTLETGSGFAWRIGRFQEAGTPFRGQIDDARVFARALSAIEVMALYRCGSGQADLTLPGNRQVYYLQLFPLGAGVVIGPAGQIRHAGNDFAGVQFAQSDGACSMRSLRGADLGQNLRMGVDLLVPASPSGAVTTAGPYFRARDASPGHGIIGGDNAGYWVQLYSTGVVKVRCLHPQQIVAFTTPPAGFDPGIFHKLEITARDLELEALLDGKQLEFDQGGRRVRTVSILPLWEDTPQGGKNRGTAGIIFSAEPRGKATGQQARNIVVTPAS